MKLILFGILFIFSPLALAFISSVINQNSMFDEGNGSGTYIWFMLFTIPVGLIVVIIGIIRLIAKKFRKPR
jgi:hypothetical protein